MSADRSFHLVAACARLAIVAALALLPWTTPPDASAGAASSRAHRLAQPLERRLATIVDLPCPAGVPNVVGPSFKGQSLVNANFNRRNLVNADFSGATLDGAVFIGADLRGANFSNATFLGSKAGFPNDFTLANLTDACFFNARFLATVAPTYFSHATLTGADFSSTDLSGGQVVLGPAPLTFDAAAPRPRFRNATVNCEFVAQWPALDLSGAKGLKACAPQLKGADLSGAQLASVDLSGIDLGRTTWTGANLNAVNFQSTILDGARGLNGAAKTDLGGAQFNSASARYIDFNGAKLGGANFSGADLEGTDFTGALFADASLGAAKFDNAHLKNASFANTDLNSVTFTYASVYGSAIGVPPQPCPLAAAPTGCPASYPRTGATCSCASMSGANLTRTDFSNAFLFGVDFSTAATIVNATTFSNAILVAADFSGATFTVDPSQNGRAPKFDKALLQGAQLSAANLNGATLNGAFVDFGVNSGGTSRTGNALSVLLTSDYTGFPNWRGSSNPCVRLRYDKASTLPVDIGTMTCPDGKTYPGVGCGALQPRDPNVATNPAWFGKSVNGNSPVPGWYQRDSTYDVATPPAQICNGNADEPSWFPANPPK